MALRVNRTVRQLHLEDFGGKEFERLVFAYHLRTERWKRIAWHGQVGNDQGRDIVGLRDDDTPSGTKIYVLCANWKKLTLAKVSADLDKAIKSPTGKPDECRVVCPREVSGKLRDRIEQLIEERGIRHHQTWFGAEFEEYLLRDCESLVRRMFDGEIFPDTPKKIAEFVRETSTEGDEECLALMARLFDRPAFSTPFHRESSIPAFKQAITNTIQALKTGIWQTRSGKVVAKIPTKQDLKSPVNRQGIARIEQNLVDLRSDFDSFIRGGDIKPCGCEKPDCPVFTATDGAIQRMNSLRVEILAHFHQLYPPLARILGWLGRGQSPHPGAQLFLRPGSIPGIEQPRAIEKLK